MTTIDLHVHSRLSKTFAFDPMSLDRLVALGRRRGLDAFALTEHIHATGFWEMHEWISRQYPYVDGMYRVAEDFSVLSGAEVTVNERVDFIVVGPLEQLRSLDAAFRPRLSEWHHPPALEFADAVRERNLILILAHPFRLGKEASKLNPRVFDLLHAAEVNGRDYGKERAVLALADRSRLPISGGSDAHFYLQVGIRATIIPEPEVSFAALRNAFEQGGTRVHAKPYARAVVELCQEVKRVTKAKLPTADEAVA